MKIVSVTGKNPYNVFFEQDGTVLVDQCHEGVTGQRFDYSEITALIKNDPSIVDRPLPVPPLDAIGKSAYKARCEDWLRARRHEGFLFGEIKCPADSEAQANFSGTLNMIALGAAGPFLLHDNDNVDHQLTVDEVKALCVQMSLFIQGAYQACWRAKETINSADTTAECEKAIKELEGFYGQ